MNLKTKPEAGSETLLILLLVLMAAALRIPALASPLEGDEAMSFLRYNALPWKQLLGVYDEPNQHTLFSLLAQLCSSLFGENEVSFRLPSLLAGILAVPLTYRVGLCLLNSKAAAIIASGLLALAPYHINYSQRGRGYALTAFLALALVYTVLKLLEGKTWRYGPALVAIGFCLVLILPSNAYFLAATGIFYCLAAWNKEATAPALKTHWVVGLIPFAILLCLTAGYFYVIYPGLKQGALYHTRDLQLSNALGVVSSLISPWGVWLYLFGAGGLLCLQKDRALAFFGLFLTPMALVLIGQLMGPPRVYIYWLPFIMMLVALGMVQSVVRIKKWNQQAGTLSAIILLAGILIPPISHLTNYYSARLHSNSPTITESKQLLAYVLNAIPPHHLIFMIGEDIMLNNYIGRPVQERMLNVFNGGRLDKIIFITNRDFPAENVPIRTYYPGSKITLPANNIKQVRTIGKAKIYDLEMKVSRFIPPAFDPDYETGSMMDSSKEVSAESVQAPLLVGKTALVVKNKTAGEKIIVSSPITLNVKPKESFLLFIYARKYGQRSNAMLLDYQQTGWPPSIAHMNPFTGRLPLLESGFSWDMIYTLFPIASGTHNFQEVIHIMEETSYFDGFQSFILYE